MDRINNYRQVVQEFLEDFSKNDAHAELVFDIPRDRYLVLHNEWRGSVLPESGNCWRLTKARCSLNHGNYTQF